MADSSLPSHLVFHGNGGSFPPHGVITISDHGPTVVVATWILVCFMALAMIARVGTRKFLERDSIALGVGCVLLVFQSTTIHLAVNYGLGRHKKSIAAEDYARYNKAVYVSQMLKIAITYLAKFSLVLIFLRLTPSKAVRRALWLFALFLTMLAIAGILSNAFQCALPRPWATSDPGCLDQRALYITYGVMNIFTDICIILVPIALLWNVQIRQSQKRAIWSVFIIRIIVCIATALELASSRKYFQNADKSWFTVDLTIWGQASVNLSIITACIPAMRPLFNMLQFSLIDSSIPFSTELSQMSSKGPKSADNYWKSRRQRQPQTLSAAQSEQTQGG